MNTSAASTETKPTEVICKGDTTTGVSGLVGTQVHLTSPWGAVPWAALPVHLCPHPPWFQQRGRFCRPPQDPLAGGGGRSPRRHAASLEHPHLTQPRDSLPQTPPRLAPRSTAGLAGKRPPSTQPPGVEEEQGLSGDAPQTWPLTSGLCRPEDSLLQLRVQQTGFLPGGHVCTSMGDSASLS